jgi:GT2 family glycosyltransferase
MALSVYILIPAHNRKETTLQCLKNLKSLGVLEKYAVVLVDDGSIDGTGIAVLQNFPTVHVLTGNGHLWWTGAISMAMDYAYNKGAEYLIWLNDDCHIESEVFASLIALCKQYPKSISGCQGYSFCGSNQVAFGGKDKTWRGYRGLLIPQGEISQCDLLSGNVVCLPRDVIDTIGYPDIFNTPHYGGDSLYLIRARKAGFYLFVDARHSTYNTAENYSNRLYPDQWLLTEGAAWRLLELVFTPQSGLSWRIWLVINWESYGFWGLTMFFKKYFSILIITALRFLPFSIRTAIHKKLSPPPVKNDLSH